MIVVSDTSPITNLIHVDHLFILQKLFHEIVIPKAVYEELCELETQRTVIERHVWIRVEEALDKSFTTSLEQTLDKGEAEAIVLAIQLKADYLLIDEMKGRGIAEGLGLKLLD